MCCILGFVLFINIMKKQPEHFIEMMTFAGQMYFFHYVVLTPCQILSACRFHTIMFLHVFAHHLTVKIIISVFG